MTEASKDTGAGLRAELPKASVDGIWAIEVHGAYEWESRGVLVLENGRATGGGDRHYSAGRYALSDGRIELELGAHYYGELRPMFGEKRAEFAVEIEGEIDGDVIAGVMSRPDRPQFTMQVRLMRMAGLGRTERLAG